MRKEFELTDEQLNDLLAASRRAPAIALQCGTPPSSQETANAFWKRLGGELGFDWATAQPVPNKGQRFFSAEVR